jgi:hypothetical protein
MRPLAAITVTVCLAGCAPDPAQVLMAEKTTAVFSDRVSLRDLRATDRRLAAVDPALGAPLALKLQPPETVLVRQAVAQRLQLTAQSPLVAVDLNTFDLFQKADGTLTARISLILNQQDASTLHRISRSLPATEAVGEAARWRLIREALQALMDTLPEPPPATTH